MASIRYPNPLAPGNTIGVTASSSPVHPDLRLRLEHCASVVRKLGFGMREGHCLMGDGIVSADAQSRASEFMAMMLDPAIHVVMPPWGGELQMNTLPLIDFDALARAPAKWFAGWSDGTTYNLPLLTLTGTATLHGMNFMDAAFAPATGAAWWRDVLALHAGQSFTQHAIGKHQRGFKNYKTHPTIEAYDLTEPAPWKVLGAERAVSVRGRLIGGCLEIVGKLIGTAYGDVTRFAHDYAPEGLLIYLENCETNAPEACRMLHQFKLAGWFEQANGVLLGRTGAADAHNFTQDEVIADALGSLDIPVIYNMDIGHVPPQLLLVNGALAEVRYANAGGSVVQTLV